MSMILARCRLLRTQTKSSTGLRLLHTWGVVGSVCVRRRLCSRRSLKADDAGGRGGVVVCSCSQEINVNGDLRSLHAISEKHYDNSG